MKSWIKYFTISFSLLISLTLAWVLVRWDDPRSFYTVIWDYPTVRLYFLISASTFTTLNIFRLVERTLTREVSFIWTRNTNAMYGYLLGTVIYFTFCLFVFDMYPRVLGLIIPIVLTNIGFNLSSVKIKEEWNRRRVLVIANIVVLAFWSMTSIYLAIDLEYKKSYIEEAKANLKKIDNHHLQRIDSLWTVFSNKREYLDNDSLEAIMIAQLRLHQEFSKYRETNDYIEYSHVDYLWNYSQMRTMLLVGLLMVVLLNGVYLIYLFRDS
jgi:hypothetical protein